MLNSDSGSARIAFVDVARLDLTDIEIHAINGSGAIHGTVAWSEAGQARVDPVSDAPRSEQPAVRIMNFDGGSFAFEGLALGKYRVRAERMSGDGGVRETTVEVQGDAPVNVVLK